MSRHVDYDTVRNTRWRITQNDDGTYPHSEAEFAVMMDIRENLRLLLAVFQCWRFQGIPKQLDKLVAAANLVRYKCPHHPKYQGKSEPKPCTGCRRVRRLYLRN